MYGGIDHLACSNGSCQCTTYRTWNLCLEKAEPMWFWSGQTVGEDEIGDVKAYNRANYLTHPGVDVTGILQRIS